MTQNRYVASKRDIIIFFIISVFYSIISSIVSAKPIILDDYFRCILFLSFFYVPEIIAIITNLIIKYADIKNEKVLKIIKVLFNIFALIHFSFFGFLVYVFVVFDW